MDNRNDEEKKYRKIKTSLRSQDQYNQLPYNLRKKSIKKFKLAYKRYRKEIISKPIIKKYKNKERYYIVWPGVN